MNKVLNINLGGVPFTIDDDAYQMLENYLQSLHNHFRQSEGYEEIMSDIEARMGELIKEGMSKRSIVMTQDVKNAVSIMGKPEDFGAEPIHATAEGKPNAKSHQSSESGASQNSGSSQSGSNYQTGKRLFRDEDNKMIGGVCSGLAAYFGVQEVTWLRIFALLLAFFTGMGFVMYMILWAIIPAAKTTADRLSMRGQPIDVNSIAKAVGAGVESLSEKVNEFGKPENQARFNSQVTEISSRIGSAFDVIFKSLGGIGKILAIIVAVLLMLALIGGWVGTSVGLAVASPLVSYVTDESWKVALATFNGFSILAVPSILLILLIRRLVFNKSTSGAWVGGLWVFWAINIFCLISIAGSFAKEFNHSHKATQRMEIADTDVLTLSVVENEQDVVSNTVVGGLRVSDEFIVAYEVDLKVEKSEDGKFELVRYASAHGRTSEEARSLAAQIQYTPSVSGNKLTLPETFMIPQGLKWRDQEVDLVLKVPVGKKIQYNRETRDLIDMNLDRVEDDENEDNCFKNPTRVWVMTEKGLKCAL
jgi:phage shock protein PspC (stress-responsive transcriptional regulator)